MFLQLLLRCQLSLFAYLPLSERKAVLAEVSECPFNVNILSL